MVSLFHHLHHVTRNCANLNKTDKNFPDFTNKHLFSDNGNNEHLPILVYSVIKPSTGQEFILNKLLSLVRFTTEGKLIFNETPRGCFCKAKLIGEEDGPKSLQNYSNQVNFFFQ